MREKKSPLAQTGLPPLNAIRAFEAAARRGNFAEAATDLNVTRWAIGKQIRALEEWFGMPLFARRARSLALTDEGTELLAGVSAAFSRLRAASGRLGRAKSARPLSGLVRINVPTSFALRWLIPRLAEFQETFRISKCEFPRHRASFAMWEAPSILAFASTAMPAHG